MSEIEKAVAAIEAELERKVRHLAYLEYRRVLKEVIRNLQARLEAQPIGRSGVR